MKYEINNFKVILEYRVDVALNDASVPLTVNAYYRLYNNFMVPVTGRLPVFSYV